MLLRPHPKDDNWRQRFDGALGREGVVAESPDWGRLDHLSNLMRHADVVVASQGSITMDAVAHDTCVDNIGFDGDADVPPSESVRKWYRMDHYRSVIETGGVWLAEDFGELDAAITACLDNPELKSEERARLRQDQLEPMDGGASKRIAAAVVTAAHRHTKIPVTGVVDSVVGVRYTPGPPGSGPDDDGHNELQLLNRS